MKVFRLNEYEWWLAETLDEAISCSMLETGLPRDEAADEDAAEVTDADMDRLNFTEDDGTVCTFRDRLALVMATNPSPGLFAAIDC